MLYCQQTVTTVLEHQQLLKWKNNR